MVVPTFSQLEPAVTSGQCVAAVADTNGAGPPGLEFQGQFPPQNEQPYGIAVSKNNTLLSRQ